MQAVVDLAGDWAQLPEALAKLDFQAPSGAKRRRPEEAIERAEHVVEARAHLARLKPTELRTLTLLAEGCSYAEIGARNE